MDEEQKREVAVFWFGVIHELVVGSLIGMGFKGHSGFIACLPILCTALSLVLPFLKGVQSRPKI